MENNTKGIGTQDKGKFGIIIGVVLLVVAIAVFAVILLTDKKDPKKEEETKQVAAFTAEMEEVFAKAKEQCEPMDFTCAQTMLTSGIPAAARTAGNGDSVMALANTSLANVLSLDTSTFGSVEDLVQNVAGTLMGTASDLVSGVLDGVGGLLGGDNGSDIKKTVTLASKTICAESQKGRIDSKFCLDGNNKKLSANVYVTNPSSTKWAVVVHPFMLNGSLIYSSLGNMYTKEGYNVLTPDLRGFGDSDGAVAMGYLESLDVYDWIQDLNDNYANRYGVTAKPETIVVHGVSLGGATTLQLATNPDIAGKTSDVYTRTLTELGVKGFVDDCGYTSMTGIITGMLSLGEMPDLAGLLGSIGIDLESFTKEFQNLANKIGLGNLFGTPSTGMGSGIMQGMAGMTDITAGIEEALKYITGGTTTIPGMDQNAMGIFNSFLSGKLPDSLTSMIPQDMLSMFEQAMQGGFTMPGIGGGTMFPGIGGGTTTPGTGNTTTPENSLPSYNYQNPLMDMYTEMMQGIIPGLNQGGSNSENTTPGFTWPGTSSDYTTPGFTWPRTSIYGASPLDGLSGMLEGLVSKVLINLIGVGLTEDNYAIYSNSFASGRNFPTNSKVMVIHGTADTMVPHSNADTVAASVNPGILVNKWDVSGQPHAFIIMGTKKDEYQSNVSKYVACLENPNCKSFAE